MNHGITLRFGASANALSTRDGHFFDMSTMDRTQRYELRRALIEGLKTKGYFGKKEQRRAKFRQSREARA